jgi:peptidoglycan/xylan/chitin deacetylase (PgdA/CDA1 family)
MDGQREAAYHERADEAAGYGEALSTVSETNIGVIALEIVMDDPQEALAPDAGDTSAAMDDPQTSTQTPPSRPSPQLSARIPPPTGPSIPYIIDNAPPTRPLFALTFDGGSLANIAGEILDTLASRGVRSTMFVTGEFIRRFPNAVSRIAAEGHELGNHTHRHPHLTTYAENRTQSTRPGVSRQTVISELNGAAQLLADRTGLRFAPLWRAPYGEYNQEICRWALEAGYIHIGWRQGGSWGRNLDTNDWVPDESWSAYKTPEEVFDKIINIASNPGGLNGGIVLMHLGTERKVRSQQVHTILGRLIDTLRGMGYEPVTVSDMLFRTGIDVGVVALSKD